MAITVAPYHTLVHHCSQQTKWRERPTCQALAAIKVYNPAAHSEGKGGCKAI